MRVCESRGDSSVREDRPHAIYHRFDIIVIDMFFFSLFVRQLVQPDAVIVTSLSDRGTLRGEYCVQAHARNHLTCYC